MRPIQNSPEHCSKAHARLGEVISGMCSNYPGFDSGINALHLTTASNTHVKRLFENQSLRAITDGTHDYPSNELTEGLIKRIMQGQQYFIHPRLALTIRHVLSVSNMPNISTDRSIGAFDTAYRSYLTQLKKLPVPDFGNHRTYTSLAENIEQTANSWLRIYNDEIEQNPRLQEEAEVIESNLTKGRKVSASYRPTSSFASVMQSVRKYFHAEVKQNSSILRHEDLTLKIGEFLGSIFPDLNQANASDLSTLLNMLAVSSGGRSTDVMPTSVLRSIENQENKIITPVLAISLRYALQDSVIWKKDPEKWAKKFDDAYTHYLDEMEKGHVYIYDTAPRFTKAFLKTHELNAREWRAKYQELKERVFPEKSVSVSEAGEAITDNPASYVCCTDSQLIQPSREKQLCA